MQNYWIRAAVSGALMATLAACGGGSDGSGMGSTASSTSTAQETGTVPLIVSDASSDDWALIGVRVISIALIPQSGSGHVTVYSAPAAAPYVNLEQLDQLGEILGNRPVPVGTYTGAVITVGGNPGDVMLTAAANPEAGFSLPRRHLGFVRRYRDPAHAGQRARSDCADHGQLRRAAGRHHVAEQCARSRIRPVAPGVHRGSHAAGRKRHALGGQFRRAGASPTDRRRHPAGATSHVWHRQLDFERQLARSPSARISRPCRCRRRRRRSAARSRSPSKRTPPTALCSTMSMPAPSPASRTSQASAASTASTCASRRATSRTAPWCHADLGQQQLSERLAQPRRSRAARRHHQRRHHRAERIRRRRSTAGQRQHPVLLPSACQARWPTPRRSVPGRHS